MKNIKTNCNKFKRYYIFETLKKHKCEFCGWTIQKGSRAFCRYILAKKRTYHHTYCPM